MCAALAYGRRVGSGDLYAKVADVGSEGMWAFFGIHAKELDVRGWVAWWSDEPKEGEVENQFTWCL